jgi:hypothetical protein
MSTGSQVALATCRELPDLTPDDSVLIERLAACGIDAHAVVWDDPAVDWSTYNLVITRSTWDYSRRREDFTTWAASIERLTPPAAVATWNTDKHYLADLEQAGVPIVATQWLEPDRTFDARSLHTRFPALGDFVIKPAISTGGKDTGRYTANNSYARGLAITHARRLLETGRTVMVQRYITTVDTAGETALIYLNGTFAYAVARDAMLTGPDEQSVAMRKPEVVRSHGATAQQIAVADQAVAAARAITAASGAGDLPPLLARVDLVDPGSGPEVLELELTVPTLYMKLAPGAPDLVASAIAERLGNFGS